MNSTAAAALRHVLDLYGELEQAYIETTEILHHREQTIARLENQLQLQTDLLSGGDHDYNKSEDYEDHRRSRSLDSESENTRTRSVDVGHNHNDVDELTDVTARAQLDLTRAEQRARHILQDLRAVQDEVWLELNSYRHSESSDASAAAATNTTTTTTTTIPVNTATYTATLSADKEDDSKREEIRRVDLGRNEWSPRIRKHQHLVSQGREQEDAEGGYDKKGQAQYNEQQEQDHRNHNKNHKIPTHERCQLSEKSRSSEDGINVQVQANSPTSPSITSPTTNGIIAASASTTTNPTSPYTPNPVADRPSLSSHTFILQTLSPVLSECTDSSMSSTSATAAASRARRMLSEARSTIAAQELQLSDQATLHDSQLQVSSRERAAREHELLTELDMAGERLSDLQSRLDISTQRVRSVEAELVRERARGVELSEELDDAVERTAELTRMREDDNEEGSAKLASLDREKRKLEERLDEAGRRLEWALKHGRESEEEMRKQTGSLEEQSRKMEVELHDVLERNEELKAKLGRVARFAPEGVWEDEGLKGLTCT